MTGPLKDLAPDEESVEALLTQATHLADLLSDSFDTPSGIPRNTIYITGNGTQASDDEVNGLATIGTLVLEWTRLSDLTGDPKYNELTQKAEDYLLSPLNPELGEPFPGLLGTNVNVTTGLFVDSSGGWNGGTDSYYEYLIKMYVYNTEKFGQYLERWIVAADSSIEYLTSHPTTRPDITFLAAYENSTDLNFVSTHCKSWAASPPFSFTGTAFLTVSQWHALMVAVSSWAASRSTTRTTLTTASSS